MGASSALRRCQSREVQDPPCHDHGMKLYSETAILDYRLRGAIVRTRHRWPLPRRTSQTSM